MSDTTTRTAADYKKILVVDDTPTVADLIREMLLSFGYHVKVCLAVQEALAEFEAGKYDLVITDYTMPGMNGVELARIMRERAPGQLILLITGSTFSMADSTVKQLPVNATLQKPFSVDEFQQSVAALVTADRATV